MTDKAMLAATSLEDVYRHHNSHQHMMFRDCRASQQQQRGTFMFGLQDDLHDDHDQMVVDIRRQHRLYTSNCNKKFNCNNESQRQPPQPTLGAKNKRYTSKTTYLNCSPYIRHNYDDDDDDHYQDQELDMDLDNIMVMYDSVPQHYVTLEDLKSSRTSCWLCGCNWLQGHVSLDCPECGGYALSRPCADCNGKCDQVWTRNIGATHNSHQALWMGKCSLKLRSQACNKQQQGGEMVAPADNQQQQQLVSGGGVVGFGGGSLRELEKKNNISNTLKPNQRHKQQQPDHHHQKQQLQQQQQQVRAREQ